MTIYDLYLESGPRERKTMARVLDLFGCVAVGPTNDDAIDAASAAIPAYFDFLQRCGEAPSAVKGQTRRDQDPRRAAHHRRQVAWQRFSLPDVPVRL